MARDPVKLATVGDLHWHVDRRRTFHHHFDTVHEVADFLVLPSYSEGMPQAVLEAINCGLPVVATRVAGIPEAVTDGKTGVLVPPSDPEALAAALARLLESAHLRKRLVAAARERVVRDFDIEKNVVPLHDLFEEAIRA